MPKGHVLSDADRFRCIFAVIVQLDVSKANVDWDKVAADIGSATTQIARQRFANIIKQAGKGKAGSRKVSVAAKSNIAPMKASKPKSSEGDNEEGGQYESDTEKNEGSGVAKIGRGRFLKTAAKRKASESEKGGGNQDGYDAEEDGSVEGEGGKYKQERGKRVKIDNGDEAENKGSEQYHPEETYHYEAANQGYFGNGLEHGSNIDDWLNQQLGPEGDYAVQQFDQYDDQV